MLMMKRKTILFCFVFCACSWAVKAQTYKLDTTFYANYNFYTSDNFYVPAVFNILESSTGDLYVSGDIYDANPYGTLLRFDSCGNHDLSFQPVKGLSNPLHVFKLKDDTIYSVGQTLGTTYYYKYDLMGNIVNNIWTQNFNSTISYAWEKDAHLYDDGSLLITAEIICHPPNNNPRYELMRFNPDGTIDSTLMADVYSGITGGGNIFRIKPYGDNQLLVFGRWTTWLGDSTVEDGLRLINLPSCTIDPGFNNIFEDVPDSLFASIVQNINVLENGQLLITGMVKIKGYEKIMGIVRLNSDGSLDSTFNYQNNMNCPYNTNVFIGKQITAITPLHDSSGYLIGGFFNSYQGQPRNNIAKINLDGYLDPQAFTGLGVDTISDFSVIGTTETSDGVLQIIPSKDGKFYVAGQIDGFNGTATPPVFRIQPAPFNTTEKIEQNKVNIYPNPASNQVYIENIAAGSSIQMFTMEGKLMKEVNCKGDIESIKLAGFKSGIYFIRITNGNDVSNSKLVISK